MNNLSSTVSLFCFPFAGGSAYSYFPWKELLPPHFQFNAIELPGRGSRIPEPLLMTVDEMVEEVCGQLRGKLEPPYVFFGHSMGSVLALLVAWKLQQEGMEPPLALFLSGRPGISGSSVLPILHPLPPDQLWKELESLGGVHPDLLKEPEIRALFEPILRADLTAIETLDPEQYAEVEVQVPVYNLMGKEEIYVEEDLTWDQYTSLGSELHLMEGGHFFIYDQFQEIANLLSRTTQFLINANLVKKSHQQGEGA